MWWSFQVVNISSKLFTTSDSAVPQSIDTNMWSRGMVKHGWVSVWVIEYHSVSKLSRLWSWSYMKWKNYLKYYIFKMNTRNIRNTMCDNSRSSLRTSYGQPHGTRLILDWICPLFFSLRLSLDIRWHYCEEVPDVWLIWYTVSALSISNSFCKNVYGCYK